MCRDKFRIAECKHTQFSVLTQHYSMMCFSSTTKVFPLSSKAQISSCESRCTQPAFCFNPFRPLD